MDGTASRIEQSAGSEDAPVVGTVLNGTVICLILLVLSAAAFALWDGRRTAVREYEDRQTRLGIVLAEDTARGLRSVDAIIATTVLQIQGSGVATSEELRGEMASHAIHEDLEER